MPSCKVQCTSDFFFHWFFVFPEMKAYECTICHERFKINATAFNHRKVAHNSAGKITLVKSEELEQLKRDLIRKVDPEDQESEKLFKRFRGSNVTMMAEKMAQMKREVGVSEQQQFAVAPNSVDSI